MDRKRVFETREQQEELVNSGLILKAGQSSLAEAIDCLNYQVDELLGRVINLQEQLDPLLTPINGEVGCDTKLSNESSPVVNSINACAQRIQSIRKNLEGLQNRLTV